MQNKSPSIFESNILYLILGMALLIIGSYAQKREIYSGLLITEYILVLIPNLFYLKLKGLSFKKVLRLNRISLKQGVLIVLIVVFSYPVAVLLNGIILAIVNVFTDAIPTTLPMPSTIDKYIIGLLVFAVTPGICEEVMFRGTIMSAYSTIGYMKSIVISSILFGLFHFNLLNLVGPTFLGIIFGIIVYKTNSIYSSILGHTVNNAIALSIGYAITKYQSQIDNLSHSSTELSQSIELIIGLIGIGFIALISFVILIRLIKKLPSGNKEVYIDGNMSLDFRTEYSDNMEVEFPITDEKFKLIKYIPIVIVILAFIYMNFEYVLL